PDPLVVGLLREVGLEVLQRDEQLAAPDSPLGALLHFRGGHRVRNVPKKGTCTAKATSTAKPRRPRRFVGVCVPGPPRGRPEDNNENLRDLRGFAVGFLLFKA